VETSLRPLQRLRSPGTMVRCLTTWQRFVLYAVRVSALPAEELQERHRAAFDADQREALQALREACYGKTYGKAAQAAQAAQAAAAAAAAVQRFSQAVLQRCFKNDSFENPLIHFAALLGVNGKTCRFHLPGDGYTGTLANL